MRFFDIGILKEIRHHGRKAIFFISIFAGILIALPRQAVGSATEKSGKATALMRVRALLQEGRLQQAEESVKTYISTTGPEADAYNLLGMVYDAEKRFDLANQAYRKAIDIDPRAASPHVNLGVNCLQRGRTGPAIQEFLIALHLDPANEVAAVDLAELSFDQQHYPEAVKYFELARKFQPDNPAVLLGAAKAYFFLGNSKKALETASALSNLPSIGPRFHFSLGLLLAQHEAYSQAIAEFDRVVAEHVESHDVFVNLGLALSRLKEYDKAKADYFKAIQCDPKDYVPYLRVGADYLAQKKVPLAIVWLMRAVQLSPRQVETMYLLGTAMDQARYYKTARKYLSVYVERQPNDPKGWALLGDAYLNEMQYQKALECYQRTLALVPNLASANYLVGYAYYLLRQLPKSKTYLVKTLDLDPTYAEAHLRLGEIAYMEGNDAQAIWQLLPLSTNQIEGGQIQFILAKSYIRRGNFTKAKVLLSDLTTRYPQDPRYHYVLAQLYKETSENDRAHEQLNLYKATEGKEQLQRKIDMDSYIEVR